MSCGKIDLLFSNHGEDVSNALRGIAGGIVIGGISPHVAREDAQEGKPSHKRIHNGLKDLG